MSARHLLSLLGIDLPIIQAPMAGVSSPEMAAAASNAGALGSVIVRIRGIASRHAMSTAALFATPRKSRQHRL